MSNLPAFCIWTLNWAWGLTVETGDFSRSCLRVRGEDSSAEPKWCFLNWPKVEKGWEIGVFTYFSTKIPKEWVDLIWGHIGPDTYFTGEFIFWYFNLWKNQKTSFWFSRPVSGWPRGDRTMANKWLHTAHLYYTKCLPSFMWQMLPNIQDSDIQDSIWTNIKGPVWFEETLYLLRSSLSQCESQGEDLETNLLPEAWPEVRPQQARCWAIYRIPGVKDT